MPETSYLTHATRRPELAEPFEVGTVQWTRRPGDGDRKTLSAGFWYVTPENAPTPMVVIGDADESIVIIEGRVRIQLEGEEAVELTAGGTASMNAGASVTWTVLEPTVEFFVYS